MFRKNVCCLLFLGLCGCHVGQLTTLYNDNTSIEKDGIRYDANNKPITGVYHRYSDTMQLMDEIYYVKGKISGLYQSYNKDGIVVLRGQFLNGVPHGKVVLYYDNGNEKEVSFYKDGKLAGGRLFYYKSKGLMRKESYKNGLKNGVFEEYYKNGAVKWSFSYVDGLQHGAQRFYTKGNNLISYSEYSKGKCNGKTESYYKNGKPKVLAKCKKGKLIPWTYRILFEHA